MILRVTPRLAGLMTVLALSGCGGNPSARPSRWQYIHAAIIAPNCATSGCHSDSARTAALSLQDGDQALRALRDSGYVLPGDPSSPLMFQLEGTERRRMPPDAPLPRADVELIRQWIVEGAGE